MEFFLLDTSGKVTDQDLALIEDGPEGMGIRSYCMARGSTALPYYPSDPKIYLREENPGIKLSPLLGNTNNYLIVSTAFKQVIAEHCRDLDVEYLPFVLYDHRKRPYSEDYFIVNPIGTFDCLDEKASGVKYGSKGNIIKIEKYVLDAAKLNDAPAFFRIQHDPAEYVVGAALARALRQNEFANVILTPLVIG